MSDDPQFDAGREALLRAARSEVPRPCPPPGTWVELQRGALADDAAEVAREHLVACAACREAALDARRFLVAMGGRGAVRPQADGDRRARRSALLALAAALLAAAGISVWWLGARRALPAAPWTVAAYVANPIDTGAPLLRDATALDPEREAALARAMEPYAAGDWAAAARALADYRAEEPEDLRAAFYHAVALGLVGERGQASPLLERVAREASPRFADEARWYLALMALDAGDAARARGLLEAVAASASPRAPEAERLAQGIDE